MNELINNLRLDSGISQLNGDPRLVVIDREGNVIDPLIGLEKFAELIAAECVNMIETAAEQADEEDVHGMRNAAGLISRAFITFYDAELKNEH